MLKQVVAWRRLDTPGHDSCGLLVDDDGWRLIGTAVFRSEEQPCHLRYEVACDTAWRTRAATVRGWIGRTVVQLAIDATPDARWTFNGAAQEDVAGLVDIDLGFTPATNLIQVRRLALAVGQEADAPVAYLDFPALTLGRLEQRYKRVAHDTYAYHAPRFDYAGQLQVSNHGFVTQYPGLWAVEALQ